MTQVSVCFQDNHSEAADPGRIKCQTSSLCEPYKFDFKAFDIFVNVEL